MSHKGKHKKTHGCAFWVDSASWAKCGSTNKRLVNNTSVRAWPWKAPGTKHCLNEGAFFFLCMLSATHEIKRSQKNMNKSFGINNDAWNKNGTTFVHTQFTLSFLSRAPIPPQIFYGLRISLWIFRINSASESKEGLSEWGNNNFGFRTGCFFFFFVLATHPERGQCCQATRREHQFSATLDSDCHKMLYVHSYFAWNASPLACSGPDQIANRRFLLQTPKFTMYSGTPTMQIFKRVCESVVQQGHRMIGVWENARPVDSLTRDVG